MRTVWEPLLWVWQKPEQSLGLEAPFPPSSPSLQDTLALDLPLLVQGKECDICLLNKWLEEEGIQMERREL